MLNTKKELLEHIKDREVVAVSIYTLDNPFNFQLLVEGTLDEALPLLDFMYDNGFGSQEIDGTIWYSDGTWSTRVEYNGSEWWRYHQCPPLPKRFT